MDSTKTEVTEDALVLIYQRNEFYKKKYRLALGVYFLSVLVIIILCSMLIYLYKNPSQPIYFVADSIGRLIADVPVDQPNMSDDEVANWVVEAVEASNTYNYMNYRSQLQSAQKYFTDYGWREYMRGLKVSNNLIGLTNRKMIVIAKAAAKPRLLKSGMLGGAYGYQFELPVLITSMLPPFNEKSRFQNPIMVKIVVRRLKLLESYRGLGVVQMIGTAVSAPSPVS